MKSSRPPQSRLYWPAGCRSGGAKRSLTSLRKCLPPHHKIEITQALLEGAGSQGTKRKMAGVIEQRDDTMYEPLSEDDICVLRQRFYDRTGDHPPEWERPTSDQLTALAGRLNAGRAPWVDFAVWAPYGERRVKEQTFRPQVWINNELVTKTITGPPHHEAWLSHFKVFRAAMIMCRAASPAALDRYAEGLRQLLFRHPLAWGLICVADETVRGEKWSRLMEQAKSKRDYDWNHKMPWEAIIKGSAFRIGGGSLQEYWDQHVLHPATMLKDNGAVAPTARQYIARIEGYAPSAGTAFDGGKGKKGKGKDAPPWPQPALQDVAPWPSVPAGAPTWPRKDQWTKKKGDGTKGKDAKGKGKKGKGKDAKGKGKEPWTLSKRQQKIHDAEARAAGTKWNDWRAENGGK